MGSKKSETTVVNQTTTPTATPEESELNKLQLEQMREVQPYALALQKQAYGIGTSLLEGGALPGYLSTLPQGVETQQIPLSAGIFDENMVQDVVLKSMRDLTPKFEKMGVPIDSGTYVGAMGRMAGDIRREVSEGNLERQLAIREANLNSALTTQYQNLNNLFNLLNLAVGGQAQIQQPVIATGGSLGQRLAGLRSINTTGQTTTTQRLPWTESVGAFGSILGGIGGGLTGAAGMMGNLAPITINR